MIRNFTVILLIYFAIFSMAYAVEENTPNKNMKVSEVADNIANQYQEMGWFSGNVLITKDGKEVFSSSYGFQDIEKE